MIRWAHLRERAAVAQALRQLERGDMANARATARCALYRRAENQRKLDESRRAA